MERVSSKNLFIKEVIATLIFLTCIILLSLLWQAGVGANPNTQLVEKVAAPWIFGPVQVLLIYLPAWIAGLIIPGMIILTLSCLPWVSKLLGEKVARLAFTFVIISILFLLLWFSGLEYWWA
ncbi:MAG TPA: hypothetical protein VFF14_01635 [Candidatus Deferrimicrobium sp.]|nr:hypothetical protein [Candidatus Deferrimicrobium sp.]